jgi:hypothetical protein
MLGRQPEMVEDLAHDDAVADPCNQLATCAAVVALERVE